MASTPMAPTMSIFPGQNRTAGIDREAARLGDTSNLTPRCLSSAPHALGCSADIPSRRGVRSAGTTRAESDQPSRARAELEAIIEPADSGEDLDGVAPADTYPETYPARMARALFLLVYYVVAVRCAGLPR